jgi:hypothetical protein
MKFIKQSSIDEFNWRSTHCCCYCNQLKKKKGVHYFAFSFYGRKGTPSFVHVVKTFFMITQRVSVETPCSSSWKIPTMNFFEAVEKVAEITGILESKSKAKMQKTWRNIVHEKIVQFCSDQYQRNSKAYKRMIGQNKWCSLIAVQRDIARIYDWLCSWWKKLCFYSTNQ